MKKILLLFLTFLGALSFSRAEKVYSECFMVDDIPGEGRWNPGLNLVEKGNYILIYNVGKHPANYVAKVTLGQLNEDEKDDEGNRRMVYDATFEYYVQDETQDLRSILMSQFLVNPKLWPGENCPFIKKTIKVGCLIVDYNLQKQRVYEIFFEEGLEYMFFLDDVDEKTYKRLREIFKDLL